jgi:hypothetical protein
MSVKDKLNPAVEVELGGKKRKLVLNHLALFSIEETEGVTFISEAMAEIGLKKLGLRNLIVLLWGCLLTEIKEFDVREQDSLRMVRREVASWILDYKVREEVTIALLKAITNSTLIPEKGEEESGDNSKKVEPVLETGSSSLPSQE